MLQPATEVRPFFYLLRLTAFGLIIAAVIAKNRAERAVSGAQSVRPAAPLRISLLSMNTRHTMLLFALLLAVVLILLVWPRLRLFVEVDSCLDAGRRWNHERATCEQSDP